MRLSILFALPLLLLAGCGGDDGDGGCGTDTSLHVNPSDVGQYAATYTPSGTATSGKRDFRISVTTDGTVGGFARDPAVSAEFESVLTGSVRNTSDACGTGQTYVELNFTLPGGNPEALVAQRGTEAKFTGSYPVRAAGTTATIGTLVVTPVIQTAQ